MNLDDLNTGDKVELGDILTSGLYTDVDILGQGGPYLAEVYDGDMKYYFNIMGVETLDVNKIYLEFKCGFKYK